MPRKDDVQVQRGGEVEPFGAAESAKEIEPATVRRPATKGTLERGWKKHRLIRDLALAERSQRELAEQYGVSQNAISQFKKRFALEVEEVRDNLADEYAGVWVADKLARIQEYQEAAEKMAAGKTPRSTEVLVTILKAVAEELGDLPARTQTNVNIQQTSYEIVGVNPEDI